MTGSAAGGASRVPVVAFFNNKGGVGKTTLVYHLAWMLADRGTQVLAADLDAQANLTSAFVDETNLERYWTTGADTITAALSPLFDGVGDVRAPTALPIAPALHACIGDLGLSRYEDDLSASWARCSDGDARAFRVTSAFWRALQQAARVVAAEVILIDLGPSLGALNRAALVAADHVVVPLGADLFSLQGLTNLGPRLRQWRGQWRERLARSPLAPADLPAGGMQPAGYIVLQHAIRDNRVVKAYQRWRHRIPETYARQVLDEDGWAGSVPDDPNCIGEIRHYHSLVPMAQEARKPIFNLRSADGAIGSHAVAVAQARQDFEHLAREVGRRTWARDTDRAGT
ncbi:MAG: ParA family protein [Kofleriaceae bacterium]|nr:ParA family protein [Kofleriaceae bacterium]MCL4224840.1 ParA family protein [Myxococcales bacterium]